jgi:flagellar protein FlaI
MSEIDLQKILAPKDDKPQSSKEEEGTHETEDDKPQSEEDGLMRLLSEKKTSKEKIIDSYGNVDIVDVDKELYLYRVKLPHLAPADRTVLDSVQKVATKIIDIRKESINSEVRKKNLTEKIHDMIAKTQSINVGENKMQAYADIIAREMGGYGLLDYLMDDEMLEEVMVVPPERDVYVFHRKYGMLLTNIPVESDEYVMNIIERIARDVSRRVDKNTPLLDARLPSGDRVNATITPASVDGPSLTIRKFREDPYTIVNMINFKTISAEAAAFLWLAAEGIEARPSNILISGGTSSGKTTFLNCLSMFIRPTDRVLTIEDTAELRLPLDHWVRLETRPPSIEGAGEISMDVLLKNSLRMRPDRIVVGEVRHDEAFTLFTAMNTGHQGSMGTIHANNSEETIVRLVSPPMNVPEQMATALDLIVVLNRINVPGKGLTRRVTEIAEVTGTKEPKLHLLYEWDSEKDDLVRLDKNSTTQKAIKKYSGLSEKKLDDELKLRKDLLQEAAKKDISSIDRFSLFVHKYYERQKG